MHMLFSSVFSIFFKKHLHCWHIWNTKSTLIAVGIQKTCLSNCTVTNENDILQRQCHISWHALLFHRGNWQPIDIVSTECKKRKQKPILKNVTPNALGTNAEQKLDLNANTHVVQIWESMTHASHSHFSSGNFSFKIFYDKCISIDSFDYCCCCCKCNDSSKE